MAHKILIVDDEPNNLYILNNCLEEAGFEVRVTNNGNTALKQVSYIKPDLILLDINMPGMDGFETCRYLKHNPVTKDTPIIFISVANDSLDKIKGLEIGAVDYITKPFQAVEVVARLNKHLTINKLQKQLEAKNAQLQDYVYHLESLASLGEAINEVKDVAQMMEHAMKVTLSVFNCDRAWLLYPCDPNATSWRVPMEITSPKYPGAYSLNTDIPMEATKSELMKYALSVKEAVAFGHKYENKISPMIVELFSVQSQLCLAIHPKIGKPWLFGLHQCSHARVWTKNELNLFREFGQQIAVSLGLYISVEELEKIEGQLSRQHYHNFIGASKPMQVIYQIIDNVATSKVNILISGETGTGKELCAEAIYKESKRANKPFIVCNCAAIPENLFESYLFGHIKGAFTGAINHKKGLVSQADGGTLFLDEIGELSLTMQSGLLRFVQTQTFYQVGSDKLEKVDVRLICATNRDLLEEIKAGNFREDLYYRIDIININLPTLRQRGGDILLLANFFLQKFAQEEHKNFQSFSFEAERILLGYQWRGNVRQLQNTIHNLVVLNNGQIITAEMLKTKIEGKISDKPSIESVSDTMSDAIRPLKDIEKEVIIAALESCDGNVEKTARLLKISPATIHRKKRLW